MISIGEVPVVPEAFPDGTQKIDLPLGARKCRKHYYVRRRKYNKINKRCYKCC